MSTITRVEVIAFRFPLKDMSLGDHSATGVGNVIYKAYGCAEAERFAVRISCDDGTCGEYVTHWVGTPSTFGQTKMLCPHLLGRDPEQRQLIFDDLKREIRAYDHMGHGPLDIALWDLAGKKYNTSVSKLLGGFRTTIPTYASTYHGQEEKGGLDSPEAFAEYAVACQEMGFTGFKIHGWHNGDAKREARTVLEVRKRVGDGMSLMTDPGCQLRTYMDALEVGRACVEAHCFWDEVPSGDDGISITGKRRLRDLLRRPVGGCV